MHVNIAIHYYLVITGEEKVIHYSGNSDVLCGTATTLIKEEHYRNVAKDSKIAIDNSLDERYP